MILREIKNIFIKNQLTEGVDFKRYEWLKGDGRAYINTKVTDLSVSDYIKTIFDDSGNIGVNIRTWGREGSGRLVIGNNNSSTSLTVWGASSSFVYNNSSAYMYDMYFDLLNNKVTINNETYSLGLPHGNGVSFLLFARHRSDNVVGYINLAKYKTFEIHNQINLVPCQLLRSIPATLDANNIARNAGECGMYDSVSGKFFGNVSNTGTFTVEGDVEPETHTGLQQIYQNKLIEGVDYETYDWLKGDGSAYINTNYLLDFDDIKTSIFRIYNTNAQVLEGTRYGTGTATKGAGTVFGYGGDNNTYGSFFSTNGRLAMWDKKIPVNVENTVIMSKDGITLNGTNITSISTPLVGSRFENVTPYLIFVSWAYDWQIDVNQQKADYKSFEIEGKLHLVPCQLLRSIPRNLDAQCKERVAGECGMIDMISGKFYGNVANSGTFTVENDNE